ncbi:G2-specific protein kinase nim-1 [Fusarium culmorum]|uniref:non-specific serine/threonine protein kinase n=1 Tax=Fusarium culmorum TaxID=5516 RepID=A0A2T4GCR9_FUSCU|nr:G2-specific protein kinase nim-1 [Fusarium culmorum]
MSSEDKYETLEKIGHGSFGIIRKVRRRTDGFIMCRKEISYLRMSQKEREQLHAEFQILSHLRHPNIVAYYHREHLKVSQDLHLYMEYCGNGDLGRVIKDLALKGQRAQESFVWSIFSQLGNAAAGPKVPAGTMTILHRDLKPENVFLGEDNSVKLGDFGLSKMIKSHDFASTYVGTPFYMSPEICAAEKYTLKSDIWSLGCIIYELCAREPPFNAKTHFQLVQKIKDGKFPALPDVYSPELYQVIKDCLRVNPDRRPDTSELLNLPVVKLMRKEKEVVDLNKSIRLREDSLRKKERDLNERLVNMEREKELIRDELDSSLRREWEVKARLEIDRLANAEIEQLQNRFEEEVQARVEAELQKKAAAYANSRPNSREDEYTTSTGKTDYPHSSVGGSEVEFPSTTDLTEYSSIESPEAPRETKKTARTPFGRAQTMFVGNPAGTPMDIEMNSPSPIAIASLSLSPRRNGNTKAPTAASGNIFAVNANRSADNSRWDLRDTLSDSEDEDVMPSPTRNIKSSKNPFTSKTRPVLTSQKSAPINRLKKNNHSDDGLGKVAAKNNIRGRTLVELQQARAGGRPMSAIVMPSTGENVSPKRAFRDRIGAERKSSGDEPVAVWDPERDEMPSPFLVRQRRIARV